jgi:AbiV family abortive infection protein
VSGTRNVDTVKNPPRAVAPVATLAEKAVTSAQRYLEDSRVLLDARSWPGAYAVATLGMEEAGKAHICATLLGVACRRSGTV